MKYMFRSSYLW